MTMKHKYTSLHYRSRVQTNRPARTKKPWLFDEFLGWRWCQATVI